MKDSSNFSVDEIGKLVTISNLLGITYKEKISLSIDLYLNNIIEQLQKIPYCPFPIAFHCVDVAILRYNEWNDQYDDFDLELLLGRKKGKTKYQFIGGFVDPAETTSKSVTREIVEEVNISAIGILVYAGSFFIDDERFKKGPHKLTTSFYHTFVDKNIVATAGDDIEEVKWFNENELKGNVNDLIIEQHLQLYNALTPLKRRNHEK